MIDQPATLQPALAPWGRFPAISRFRVLLRAREPIRLPPYAGSAWRGLLGMALRRTLCVTRLPRCEGCLLHSTCAYVRLFESPAMTPADQARSSAIPHPFVLDVEPGQGMDLAPGAPLSLGLSLIGPAIPQLPYFIHALGQAGERGIGKAQGRFDLLGVDQEITLGAGDWTPVFRAEDGRCVPAATQNRAGFCPPERVRMDFRTPLRIKHRGRLVGAQEFQAALLTRHLLWRLESLDRHYGQGNGTLDRECYGEAESQIRLAESRLCWRDWTRYSSRQDSLMQLGGLIGDLVLEGEGLAVLGPALWLGQWTHLGKATSFGLGRYRLEPAASLPNGGHPGD